jgi:hypothetical protein
MSVINKWAILYGVLFLESGRGFWVFGFVRLGTGIGVFVLGGGIFFWILDFAGFDS